MYLRRVFRNIDRHYKNLVKMSNNKFFVGIINEWIVDNYYILIEQKEVLNKFLKIKKNRKYVENSNKIYSFLSNFLKEQNYKIDEENLILAISDFQTKNSYNLSYKELKMLPNLTNILLINKINDICNDEMLKIKDLEQAKKIIVMLKDDFSLKAPVSLKAYFNIEEDTSIYLISYLNEYIKELGKNARKIFKQFNNLLTDNDITLRDVINKVHLENANNSLTIANVFVSINQVNKIKIENLFSQLSNVEKLLNEDIQFSNMTLDTKNAYREKIRINAKKEKITAYEYAEKILNEDMGIVLFKEGNNKFKTILYLSLLFLATVTISYFLASFLTVYKILGFICLLIPVSEIVNNLVKMLFLQFNKSKTLPKMDFSDGVPDDYKTMVVVPTIIKDEKKIRTVFENLESFYLSNKSENIYYSLLGDCSENSKQFCENDDKIVIASQKIVDDLNAKYGKNIFYFAYRKRVYNKSEESWLGYERKRGALINFNDLLLGTISKDEERKYFNAHSFHGFKEKIKYVITLDVDTKLCLDSALKLIGTMAHPLNKPVIDENKNIVVSGYAIMQPKISIDISSTNKSLFSQIYAGIGGFDSYSSVFPDFYQDVFKSGSFVGKGIYDLNVYQQVLKDRFPNNLILSHDLIEGNYLRCANVFDIDLIDDFPSKFLVDASRRARWARGDFQITGWLKNKVRNLKNEKVSNPISLLGKWKILDNIRRGLIDFFLVLVIILSFMNNINPLWWFVFTILVVSFPILSLIRQQLNIKNFTITNIKYYNVLTYGNKSVILRTLSMFADIPFNAFLYVSSFIKSAYRMNISKKRLLNWITAEDAEKFTDSSINNNIKQFWPNYLVGIIILILSIINGHYFGYLLSFVFFMAPFISYSISKEIVISKFMISPRDDDYLKEIAKKTWQFFEDNLTLETNYLIPDNYQLNRDYKIDLKTSPTNIGLSLTAVVSAHELRFISDEIAIDYFTKMFDSIEKLQKWNGHLYNWYNIKTLEVMKPNFVSTVDSGNFIASLIVVKEFLKKINAFNLMKQVENLITTTNFKMLYTENDHFSVGYNDDEGQMEPSQYDKFMSESRITSYIAIAKGDIPSKHWFGLDKTLTTYKSRKGVISWSGTAFEYFMPLIYMKSYPNTLLDESYYFAHYVQRKYMEKINIFYPWGISESAYDDLDDSQNYKYKAFGIPQLKLREELSDRIVISPYSSVLAITEFPKDVIGNIKKYEELDMFGKYGLYESFDATNNIPVYSFFAHHQGMILASITNLLKKGAIQEYFANDDNNKVFNILTKEKVQFKPAINFKISKYKKYSYQKETFANDIRVFYHISTLPELSVLSNSKYSLILNDRGNGYSKYKSIQLNRFRKITEQDYGMFMYIKDLETNKVWSNTYAPINKMPKKYEVVFALDRIKFIRHDNDIQTTTEVIVTKTHNAEIRKVTFKNSSYEDKNLELTTYTEPILSENNDDIAHRTFNNLFVKSAYDEETNSLILTRKKRDAQSSYYLISRLLIENPLSDYQYETNRINFIGSGNNIDDPSALRQKLSNNAGTSIEPIVSLRNTVKVPKKSEVTVYMITGFGKSYEQVMEIIKTYSTPSTINEKGFAVSTIISNASNKLVDMSAMDMHLYNTMLNYLLQTNQLSITEERNSILKNNVLAQSNLWRYGISGDRPIILLEIKDVDDLSLLKELLRAFEYYKSKAIFVDLVIINCENEDDAEIISKEVETEKYHMYAINGFYKNPGNIFVLNGRDVSSEERTLLKTVARLKIDSSVYNALQYYIDDLQKPNTASPKMGIKNINSLPIKYNEKDMMFFNNYGGFINNGKEYQIINNKTPRLWSNVIATSKFGTITTNNNAGFTYAYNSREYKLTSWTNDILLNDFSEGIRINNNNILFDITKFGFGYSKYYGKTEDLDIELTQFIAQSDLVKFYKLKVKNRTTKKQSVELKYWLNPSLGVTEEKTSRHILSDFDKENNYIKFRNVYDKNFNDVYTFVSVTNPIESVNIDRILYKEFTTFIDIDSKNEKEITFMLGAGKENEILPIITKYNNTESIESEFVESQKYWDSRLNNIQVETPDDSFNYMINGWLLYQTISSRINARAGFYQVSGAYGFRDQLQDSMNICSTDPEITRKQILFNASHQFKQGDVLHWWHEETKSGLRSLYKDDYLWLIYAVYEYINITNDLKILDEKIPFVEGPLLGIDESERSLEFIYSSEKASLYEHCKLAIDKAMNEIGTNGLPLIGGGDWNDGINKVGIGGKGTSVWLGFFLYQMIGYFKVITKKYSSKDNMDKYSDFNEKLKENIKTTSWDGNYYMRAFFDNGHKLGSETNKECRIDLISQSFAILTDIADDKQKEKIFAAVEEKLVDKNINIIKLLDPPFEHSEDNPGYIMDYPKGIRENGGQYTHAVSWYIMALLKEGLVDRAFKYYQMINPINRTLTKEAVQKYKVEPYVIAADIYSNEDYMGQGGWTWYTGSSGWFYRVGLIDILGFQKHGDKLYIKPNIPSDWKKYKITYKYYDTVYEISINKASSNEIIIDNETTKNDYINLVNDNKTHEVVVNFKK